MFKDKTLMIRGKAGSFGNTVLNHFINYDLKSLAKYITKKVLQNSNNKKHFMEPNIVKHQIFKLTNYKITEQKIDIILFLMTRDKFKDLTLQPKKVVLNFCGIKK